MTNPAISVDGLRCSYSGFEAVRGVSLSVAPGELFALLGTNGAGKTTTVETIEGHRRADSGRIRVLGHDPYHEKAAIRPRVGMMLQESGFAGDLTVSETARLWRGLRSRGGDPDAVLERIGLAHRRTVRVKQLSGGEKRRLDLALAIMNEPEVLFLDEPTTGLDPTSRADTLRVIRELRAAGVTILLTTHYLEEAEVLADQVAIMHEGRVRVAGPLAEVLAGHAARITFDLPPDVPMSDLPPVSGGPDTPDPTTGRVVIATHDLQGDLYTLLTWAHSRALGLTGLRAEPATLNDVFLAARHDHTDTIEVTS